MKKLLLFLLLSIGLNAQFNYQAIVKDSNGNTMTNNQVKFKFTLMESSSTSSPVYVEEHTVITPQSGVVNLSIGAGDVSSGSFSGIDWSNAVYVKEELDTGSGYEDMGTRQFASVPVAEYAKNTRGISFQNQALFIDELIASSVSITTLSVSNTIEVGNGIISGGTVTATSFAGYGSSLLWSQGSTQTLSEKIDDLAQLIIGNNVSSGSTPSNGLVAFFPFDGNVNDVSGNNNHGIVYGATLTTDQNGNTESAYEFNGASSIDIGNSDSLNPSNSISFYCDFLIPQSFSNNYILGRNPDSSSDYGYNFGIVGDDNTQSIRFGLGNNSTGSNINDISANVDLNKNQWYSLAVTYDGTQVKFYLNGSLLSTENLTLQAGIHQNDYNTFIGKYRPSGGSNGLQFFKGKLDNVGIWNRALTNQEIQNLYFKEDNVFEDASRNIAFGESALSAISTGTDNIAIGNEALSKNLTGTYNVAVGIDALRNNTASRNTALGSLALRNNTTGTINTALGYYSLVHNETGGRNVGLGDGSLYYNVDGSYNVALGNLALTKNVSGNSNVSIGDASLYNSISSNNVALGDGAGYDLNTENSNDNTFLGNNANTVSGTQINNATSIGANAIVTTSNTIQLGDSNVTLVNTSGAVSATSFKGNADQTTLTYSGTVTNVLAVISDLQRQIAELKELLNSGGTSTTESNTGIYLADNGVTIKCENASVGVTSTINDKVYTVVSEASLRAMVANDEDVTCVCTSLVTDLSELFLNKGSFNQDIGSWDTSNVTDMYGMFADAVSFNQSLNYWDVSNVTTMELMFVRANSFNSEIGNWNIASLTSLKDLFLSASSFNQDISSWNTSNITSMYGVFNKARAFNQDISSWDTSNVTNMRYLFQEAEQFNQDISGWDTSNVTDMRETFNYALSFDQDLSGWCVTNITALPQAFDDNSPMKLDWTNKRPVWGTCPP